MITFFLTIYRFLLVMRGRPEKRLERPFFSTLQEAQMTYGDIGNVSTDEEEGDNSKVRSRRTPD